MKNPNVVDFFLPFFNEYFLRNLMKNQRKTWEVEGCVWCLFHAHCKLGATMEQIIGLRLWAVAFDEPIPFWMQHIGANWNDIISWAVTLLKSKADCSWCYAFLIGFMCAVAGTLEVLKKSTPNLRSADHHLSSFLSSATMLSCICISSMINHFQLLLREQHSFLLISMNLIQALLVLIRCITLSFSWWHWDLWSKIAETKFRYFIYLFQLLLSFH